MDHELITEVIKEYKKDYVPKYLQSWIEIGTLNKNGISPLSKAELKSTVSQYEDGRQFIAYGYVNIWIQYDANIQPLRTVKLVQLMDNMDNITQIKHYRQFIPFELKSCLINESKESYEKTWNEGKILKLEDTIMSTQLYQDNCVIMVTINKEKVNYYLLYFL